MSTGKEVLGVLKGTTEGVLNEILFVTSYPPRECGIATYSQDLIKSIINKFSKSVTIKVCALESDESNYTYPEEVKYILNTSMASEFKKMADHINNDATINMVLLQHEFGFYNMQKEAFQLLITEIKKPTVIVFHTVLPHPDEMLKLQIQRIASAVISIIVMTQSSSDILMHEYDIPEQMITVIAHGTHLVPHLCEKTLKAKYDLTNRKVLSTFGLISSGKGIETTIEALPEIVKQNSDVLFLIIGKTHPEVVKNEGEKYREMLEQKVVDNELQNHVRFINKYVELPELLEYLQLTDIYLFTANNPFQAVSGTFAYAMSCACPIVSTPIPHAKEVLTEDTGIIFDFDNSKQLAESVNNLLTNDEQRKNISTNALQEIVSTAWENSAVKHVCLFEKISETKMNLQFDLPKINLEHLNQMTTEIGIIQFSKINQPDINTGYTLDDNARALIVLCMYYKKSVDKNCLSQIKKYLDFIKYCQQPSGLFLNYTDRDNLFTNQNNEVNLEDSNGRAIWALGYVISLFEILPKKIILEADQIITKTFLDVNTMHSTRAMAFSIKGLFYYNSFKKSSKNLLLINTLANRMFQMYKHESSKKWDWFESYLTYANSILPEAMLYAWLMTGKTVYKETALSSLSFLLSKIFNENGIEVISNRKWFQKDQQAGKFGEQPIDVAYTIMTLAKFYDEFKTQEYRLKMVKAFNWFLGDNRLHQIIYNPCTGGCYDGLEESNINLNQGAESTVSYLMARLTIENYTNPEIPVHTKLIKRVKVHHKQVALIYSTDTKEIKQDIKLLEISSYLPVKFPELEAL